MKLDVTREVVSDLWPSCRAGEASTASQRLVDEFLAGDREFAAVLRESDQVKALVPSVRLSPEAELRLLQEAGRRARTKLLIIGGSIGLAATLLFAAFAGALLVFARGGM
jgi:hypothetical protein